MCVTCSLCLGWHPQPNCITSAPRRGGLTSFSPVSRTPPYLCSQLPLLLQLLPYSVCCPQLGLSSPPQTVRPSAPPFRPPTTPPKESEPFRGSQSSHNDAQTPQQSPDPTSVHPLLSSGQRENLANFSHILCPRPCPFPHHPGLLRLTFIDPSGPPPSSGARCDCSLLQEAFPLTLL